MRQTHTTAGDRRGLATGGGRLCPGGGSVAGEAGVVRAYLATDHAGATPRRLRVLLYDAAIRLCRQSLTALDEGQPYRAADTLARAERLVEQLRRDLQADGPPGRFATVYDQVARRLAEAGFYRRREPVSETIRLLRYWRRDWDMLARSLDQPPETPPARAESWVG